MRRVVAISGLAVLLCGIGGSCFWGSSAPPDAPSTDTGLAETESESEELPPPACKSDAWIEAVADAYCRRIVLCYPDDRESEEWHNQCVDSEMSSIRRVIGQEGQYTGGTSPYGHGACANDIDCRYPLVVEEECPSRRAQWYWTECLD